MSIKNKKLNLIYKQPGTRCHT